MVSARRSRRSIIICKSWDKQCGCRGRLLTVWTSVSGLVIPSSHTYIIRSRNTWIRGAWSYDRMINIVQYTWQQETRVLLYISSHLKCELAGRRERVWHLPIWSHYLFCCIPLKGLNLHSEVETGYLQLQSREDRKNERMFTNLINSTFLTKGAQAR